MKFSFNRSIGLRFLRVVFGSYLFVTVTVTSYQLYAEYSNARKGVIIELIHAGQSFSDGVSKALWNLDSNSIESILTGIRKINVVAGVKVTSLNNEIFGTIGTYADEQSTPRKTQKPLSEFDNLSTVAIKNNGSGLFYQYTVPLFFHEEDTHITEQIGMMRLFADHHTVISRFRHSFFLILANAAIKTLALWLIFLYFAKKIVVQPLNQLTEATQSLTSGNTLSSNPDTIPLTKISESDNEDELQQLASSFLIMRDAILQKIENLNLINNFAVKVSTLDKKEKVFETTTELLQRVFGCKHAVIIDNNNYIYWRSANANTLEVSIRNCIPGNAREVSAANRTIIYSEQDVHLSQASLQHDKNFKVPPLLALPLLANGFENRYFCFLGELHFGRLNDEGLLSDESNSFLQVVGGIVDNALTNIYQRELIEQHKQHLELRVEERTQELAEVNKELKYLALHDPLTNLPNRTLFHDRLDHAIELARRNHSSFALAIIDLTKFKYINDTFGHDAGDTVLREVAKRFSQNLRSSDTIARMGGDEFAAILTDTHDHNAITTILQHLSASLEKPITLANQTHIIASANIGASIFPEQAKTSHELFNFADAAMYQTKRAGVSFAIYDGQQDFMERECMELLGEVVNALEDRHFTLFFQPIVDCNDQRIVGLEALVRWHHPQRGTIQPNDFIKLVENSEYIIPLSCWTLQEACRQCASLHLTGHDIYITINLTESAFHLPSVAACLHEQLKAHSITARWIKIEISEAVLMGNPEKSKASIERFAEIGVAVIIDNFGTAQSSLVHLSQWPLSALKIDKQIMQTNSNNRAAIKTISDLAASLNVDVIAVGIEQLDTLALFPSQLRLFAQGFYFGHPVDSKGILTLLDTHKS